MIRSNQGINQAFRSRRGPERSLKVFPVAGGEAKVLAGAAPGDWPVQWTSDGRGVYVMK